MPNQKLIEKANTATTSDQLFLVSEALLNASEYHLDRSEAYLITFEALSSRVIEMMEKLTELGQNADAESAEAKRLSKIAGRKLRQAKRLQRKGR